MINIAKARPAEKVILPQQANLPNTMKQVTVSSDSLTSNQIQMIRDQQQQQQLQLQLQLQQQLLQQKRQQQSQQLQQEIKAITNFNATIQEHLQMRQATSMINGLVQQPAPQYTSLLHKKDNSGVSLPTSQVRFCLLFSVTHVFIEDLMMVKVTLSQL